MPVYAGVQRKYPFSDSCCLAANRLDFASRRRMRDKHCIGHGREECGALAGGSPGYSAHVGVKRRQQQQAAIRNGCAPCGGETHVKERPGGTHDHGLFPAK